MAILQQNPVTDRTPYTKKYLLDANMKEQAHLKFKLCLKQNS